MTTLKRYGKNVWRFVRHNRAVSALEYAILIGVIALAVGAALTTFGTSITDAITQIGSSVKTEAVKYPSPSPSPSPSPTS